jgi:hypothetical protein
VLPQRQSARTRGQAPDPALAGGIDYEARDGRVVLAAFVPERYASSAGGPWDAALAGVAISKPPPGPQEFKSSNGDADTDAAFLQQLRSYTTDGSGTSAAAASAAGGGGVLGVERVSRLRLQSVDVAKLTTQGISCLAFHPSSSKPIIAAADKSGKVRVCTRPTCACLAPFQMPVKIAARSCPAVNMGCAACKCSGRLHMTP